MLDALINTIQSNPFFPVSQVIYGYSDKFSTPPFVFVDDLKPMPTYDTGGISFMTTTFSLLLVSQNFDTLLEMDAAIRNYLTGNLFTPDAFGVIYDGSEVVEDERYVYRMKQSWTIFENIR